MLLDGAVPWENGCPQICKGSRVSGRFPGSALEEFVGGHRCRTERGAPVRCRHGNGQRGGH